MGPTLTGIVVEKDEVWPCLWLAPVLTTAVAPPVGLKVPDAPVGFWRLAITPCWVQAPPGVR